MACYLPLNFHCMLSHWYRQFDEIVAVGHVVEIVMMLVGGSQRLADPSCQYYRARCSWIRVNQRPRKNIVMGILVVIVSICAKHNKQITCPVQSDSYCHSIHIDPTVDLRGG